MARRIAEKVDGGRSLGLEAAIAALWAPLDHPATARPVLALWLEEAGWRCPFEARHAVGANAPLAGLPIRWRAATLAALQDVYGADLTLDGATRRRFVSPGGPRRGELALGADRRTATRSAFVRSSARRQTTGVWRARSSPIPTGSRRAGCRGGRARASGRSDRRGARNRRRRRERRAERRPVVVSEAGFESELMRLRSRSGIHETARRARTNRRPRPVSPYKSMGESLGRLQSHEKQFTESHQFRSGCLSIFQFGVSQALRQKRPLPPIGLVRTVRGRVDRRRRAHPRGIRGARGAGGPAIEAKAVRRLSANFAWARGRTGGCPAVERERHRQFLSMMSWMSDKAIIGHS